MYTLIRKKFYNYFTKKTDKGKGNMKHVFKRVFRPV